jgi:hypothetical protein
MYFPFDVVWKIQILKFKHSFAWQDDFKSNICQLQSFIIFQNIQFFFYFGGFSIRGRLENLNFYFFKFRCSSRWQYEFKSKGLPTTKFYNFSRSTKFILIVRLIVHPTWKSWNFYGGRLGLCTSYVTTFRKHRQIFITGSTYDIMTSFMIFWLCLCFLQF